jgi:hypothetical protein
MKLKELPHSINSRLITRKRYVLISRITAVNFIHSLCKTRTDLCVGEPSGENPLVLSRALFCSLPPVNRNLGIIVGVFRSEIVPHNLAITVGLVTLTFQRW